MVKGGARLEGEVAADGAKNAALPLLAATLLTAGECVLGRVPQLTDVATMLRLLSDLGVRVRTEGPVATVQADALTSHEAPYDSRFQSTDLHRPAPFRH